MKVCLFDIDGTLVLTGGAGKSAIEAALATEFDLEPLTDGVPMSGRTDRAIARDLFQMHGIEDSAEHWRRLLARYLQLLPEHLARYQGQVLPGVAELLDVLGTRDHVAVGLLTGNTREGARLKLTHYGLMHHFGFGGYGESHFDRRRVAEEALGAARSHLSRDIDAGDVWVIGDTPFDVHCARAIGARVVAVATGWHSKEELAEAEPDVLVGDLSDTAAVFDWWE